MADDLIQLPADGVGKTVGTSLISGKHSPWSSLKDEVGAYVFGTTTSAAVDTDTNGTAIGFLRGIVKILASVLSGGRLKVSPIVGQDGVAAGAGAVGVTVPRTTLASDDPAVAVLGATGDAAVTTNTTGSLSGKLRGVVAHLVTLIAKTPALGTAGSASTDVITVQGIASGTSQPVKEVRSSTPTQSSVAGSASSVVLLASNTARLGATIFNDSTAVLQVKLGVTASATSFSVELIARAYYEVPFEYTGAIHGIWASATGNARITELT